MPAAPQLTHTPVCVHPPAGVVLDIDGLALAEVLHMLGAGRSKAGEPVNHSVGAELLVTLGQRVQKGEFAAGGDVEFRATLSSS